MKRILVILMLVISLPIFSQTRLSGKFERVSHRKMIWWESNVFWLDSTGKFKFVKYGDAGNSVGKGIYKITDDELILKFADPDTTMPDVNGAYNVRNIYNLDGIIKYNIKVTDDENGEPLYGARVSTKINGKYVEDMEVNEDGNTELIIEKSDLPSILQVTYVNYYLFEYIIDDTMSRDIEIRLIQDKYPLVVSFYTKNDLLKFDIRDVTDNSFHLKINDFPDWLLYQKTGEYNDK